MVIVLTLPTVAEMQSIHDHLRLASRCDQLTIEAALNLIRVRSSSIKEDLDSIIGYHRETEDRSRLAVAKFLTEHESTLSRATAPSTDQDTGNATDLPSVHE
jgi:HPt (histidine-containing phosphotransfer) domain-containing protein